LVVDDQPFVRDVLARAVRGMGLEALPAASGEEALELCRLHGGRVGLALLDLRMPGMGGLAALAELRRDRPELAVLLVCGDPGDLSDPEALRLGARGLLRKPLRLGELQRAVRSCLPGV
jgi:CheY-like chemotaxis protein